MALTDVAVRTAKAREEVRKLADEKGMYLLTQSSGAKLRHMDYAISTGIARLPQRPTFMAPCRPSNQALRRSHRPKDFAELLHAIDEYRSERKRMMREWADYLSKQNSGVKGTQISGNAA